VWQPPLVEAIASTKGGAITEGDDKLFSNNTALLC
jgi:hypothetical protein